MTSPSLLLHPSAMEWNRTTVIFSNGSAAGWILRQASFWCINPSASYSLSGGITEPVRNFFTCCLTAGLNEAFILKSDGKRLVWRLQADAGFGLQIISVKAGICAPAPPPREIGPFFFGERLPRFVQARRQFIFNNSISSCISPVFLKCKPHQRYVDSGRCRSKRPTLAQILVFRIFNWRPGRAGMDFRWRAYYRRQQNLPTP